MDEAVIALKLKDASNWWHDINESTLWQDRIFHILAALYGLVAAVALSHSLLFPVSCCLLLTHQVQPLD